MTIRTVYGEREEDAVDEGGRRVSIYSAVHEEISAIHCSKTVATNNSAFRNKQEDAFRVSFTVMRHSSKQGTHAVGERTVRSQDLPASTGANCRQTMQDLQDLLLLYPKQAA